MTSQLSLGLFYLDVLSESAPEDGKGGCLHTKASSWTIRFMHERANHPREEGGGKDPETEFMLPYLSATGLECPFGCLNNRKDGKKRAT